MKSRWVGASLLLLSASFPVPAMLFAQTGQPAPQPAQAAQQNSNPLIDQLKSADAGARAKAAREMGKSGDATVVPPLAQALKDESDKVRREVVYALASIHTSESLDALTTATHDADSDVRALAVQCVIGYYSGVVPTAGFAGTMKKQLRRAKQLFVQNKTQVDPGTPIDPKVVSALEAAMADTNSLPAARESAKGLGILMARPAVPDLVKGAHKFDEDLAREALNSLSKIEDTSVGPQLVDLLNSPYKDVKRDACVTVGILRAREALPKLQAIIESDSDMKDREKAIEGLAYLGDRVSVPLFMKEIWSQDSKGIRTSAAEGLARAADPATSSELERALSAEKDAGVRLAIDFALTALGKDEFVSAIVDELANRMRGDAAEAYLTELARNPKFLPKLYTYLSAHEATVRRRLCRVLMFSGDGTSLDALERLSHDSNGDVATAALRARQSIRARTSAPPAAKP